MTADINPIYAGLESYCFVGTLCPLYSSYIEKPHNIKVKWKSVNHNTIRGIPSLLTLQEAATEMQGGA